MLINLKSLSPVIVTICNMSVSLSNRFHTKQANSDKITSFLGGRLPLFDALVRREPPHSGARNFVTKN